MGHPHVLPKAPLDGAMVNLVGSELAVDEVGSCIPDLKDSDPSDLFFLVESYSLVMEDSVFRSMSSHFF